MSVRPAVGVVIPRQPVERYKPCKDDNINLAELFLVNKHNFRNCRGKFAADVRDINLLGPGHTCGPLTATTICHKDAFPQICKMVVSF